MPDLTRTVVIGTSCSGKSTFARELATRLGSPHTELDSLSWLPGWIERDRDEFRALMANWAGGERWVIDGNYTGHARSLLWPRATALIWLDYPFPLVLWRSVRRTIMRAATGQVICNGNRESWRKSFLSRESIILWVIKTHGKNRERFGSLVAGTDYPNAEKIRFEDPAEARAFLARLPVCPMRSTTAPPVLPGAAERNE
ncbi:MAG: hypothetical protein AAGA21_12555 [Pseudomonadota bacterium]